MSKYVTSTSASISLLLQTILNLLDFRKRFLDPSKINWVLPKCSDNRFSDSHSLRDSSSTQRKRLISSTFLPDVSRAESSA